MKKQLISLFLSGLVAISNLALAEQADTSNSKKSAFDKHMWSLSGPDDAFTIQNASSNHTIAVEITVDYHYQDKNPGINIKNCGNTTHADPTHPVVCYNSDAKAPISFTSTSQANGIMGTYQIERI